MSSVNPMRAKSPEERRAIVAKGLATRRANREARQELARTQERYAGELGARIAALEAKLAALQRMEAVAEVSAGLCGKALLHAGEIARKAKTWIRPSGVYFLLDGDEVVYVGQAVNVFARIEGHREKRFDRFAFVPCAPEMLDKLESLYIHCLRPRLNGESGGVKVAPISLVELLGGSAASQSMLENITCGY